MEQSDQQRIAHDAVFEKGSRSHVTSDDPLVKYVVHWRLKEGFRRLRLVAGNRITRKSPVLVLCAGDGSEGTILCDIGFEDVTVSDISPQGVAQALKRDPRLKGIVANAEKHDAPAGSYDVVIVQDGLHHLARPVLGFTEMLRLARVAVLFLEPHDCLVGKIIGTKWEKNGTAINYVFRWSEKLVDDVASSYLGQNSFRNLSFAFWHHNITFHKVGVKLGGGQRGVSAIRLIKLALDTTMHRMGNQFCGLVLKTNGEAHVSDTATIDKPTL